MASGRSPMLATAGTGSLPAAEMKCGDRSDLAACIAKELKVKDAILDGEMAALDSAGRPAFYELMKRNGQPIFTGSIFFG